MCILSAIVIAVSMIPLSASATATFSNYPTATTHFGSSQVTSIDGALWYLQTPYSKPSVNHIARMTTSGVITNYDIPTLAGVSNLVVASITAGPDGNVWFNGFIGSSVSAGRLDIATGTVTLYSTWVSGSNLGRIVTGSDGNLWYYNKYNGAPANTYVLKLNPSTGTTTTAATFDTYTNLTGIAAGSDGKIWITDTYYKRIYAYTTAGSMSISYNVVPVTGSITYLGGATSGPGGDIWVRTNSAVYRFSIASGTLSAYTPPTGTPMAIPIAGTGGANWFIGTSGKIGRISSTGGVTEYTVPGSSISNINNLVHGPDGAMWFSYSESGVRKLGRLEVTPDNQTITFTSTTPSSAKVDGATYAPTATATSGLPVAITVDSSSSSVCTIVSGVVSFQGAGTCTLNANQGGNIDYNAAPQVQQVFTVAPVESDISVALSCPTTASISDPVACTITVTNNGPATAENVSLAALFSNSFSGTSLTGGGTLSGQSITWSTASLAPSASAALTFDATAAVVSRASFSTSVLQTNPDSNISNNIAQSTILIN